MTRDVLIYTFDTMADWEFSYVSTVLQFQARAGDDRFRVRFVGETPDAVRTLGGLLAHPDVTLGQVDAASVAMLVLPGGNTWGEGHQAVLDLAGRLIDAGTPVAAICGATTALARAGLLERHAHVCDADDDFPDYPGQHARVHGVVAADDPLVTAVGEAPLEFTREILLALGVDTRSEIDRWYGSFKDIPDAR